MDVRKILPQQSYVNNAVVDEQKDQSNLILFVDINGTIIANDSAKNKDADTAILQLLAENYAAQWDTSKSTEVMTYRKYIEKYLLADDESKSKNKKARPEDYKEFINFLEKTKHPLHEEMVSIFNKIKKILSDSGVFPSFLKLINTLEKEKTPFTIILRTFGNDAQNVIKELENKTNLKFSNFATFKTGYLTNTNKNVLKTTNEILQSIKPNEHGAWQDDYSHWNSHGETHAYGKPYLIDLNSKNTMSLFFDDNATDKKILSVQLTSGDVNDQANFQKELINLGRIVPVNTLRAILEEDYFKNCVDYAVKQRIASKATTVSDNIKVSDHSIFRVVTSTVSESAKSKTSAYQNSV